MEQITIAGQVFNAPVRYEEGHELSAGEASALNQTYHENLRNNFAGKVKAALEAGNFDQAAAQAEFDAYAQSYQFGVRSGGGGAPRDPIQSEANRIAKDQIRQALKKAGKKIGDVDTEALNNAVKALLAKNPQIMELAKKRVEEAQAAATGDLAELVSTIPSKAPEAAQPTG